MPWFLDRALSIYVYVLSFMKSCRVVRRGFPKYFWSAFCVSDRYGKSRSISSLSPFVPSTDIYTLHAVKPLGHSPKIRALSVCFLAISCKSRGRWLSLSRRTERSLPAGCALATPHHRNTSPLLGRFVRTWRRLDWGALPSLLSPPRVLGSGWVCPSSPSLCSFRRRARMRAGFSVF